MSKPMRVIAWTAALAVLAAALVFFNLPSPGRGGAAAELPAAPASSAEAAEDTTAETAFDVGESAETPAPTPDPARFVSDAPLGWRVGEQLPDFTLTCVDGTDFTLSACRGRVTVLNFWATWCAPCVKELPHFDRLQREHPDTVAVLAIHSDFVTDDVADYLAGFDYTIPFAIDADGAVTASVNGSTMLPQTVVLNRRGEVVYNQVNSVTYEALEELVALAMGEEESAVPGPVLWSYTVSGGMENEYSAWTLRREAATGAVTLTAEENGETRVYLAPADAPETLLALLADFPPETWEQMAEAEFFALDAPDRTVRLVLSDGTEYAVDDDREEAWRIRNVVREYFDRLMNGGA